MKLVRGHKTEGFWGTTNRKSGKKDVEKVKDRSGAEAKEKRNFLKRKLGKLGLRRISRNA